VRPADGQWRKAARAGASALWPRGTGLSLHARVTDLDAQWRRRRPRTAGTSDASACARPGYGAADVESAQRDVTCGSAGCVNSFV
jgi:hypothetical protein